VTNQISYFHFKSLSHIESRKKNVLSTSRHVDLSRDCFIKLVSLLIAGSRPLYVSRLIQVSVFRSVRVVGGGRDTLPRINSHSAGIKDQILNSDS